MSTNNIMTKEFNELRDFLMAHNYKVWETKNDEFNGVYLITQKLQRRVDIENPEYTVCYCNDKLFINVDITQAVIHGNLSISAEVHLCHENGQGEWCKLKIYSLKPEDIYTNLDKYEQKILKLWKVFCEDE